MRASIYAVCFGVMLIVSASATMAAARRSLPTCDAQIMQRQGRNITIRLDALSKELNGRLTAAHSNFSDLRLTSDGSKLQVSGKKNGTPISISGPLTVTGKGLLQLHANHIHKNGSGVEGIMSLFGENLSDYVNLKKTQSMSVKGNNLRINPDKLLGLRGRATKVKLQPSSVELRFAAQPCQ